MEQAAESTFVEGYVPTEHRPPRGTIVPTPGTDLALDEINLADLATWGRLDIDGVLAKRRRERPVGIDDHRSGGLPFWSFTRWADVAAITSNPDAFTSTMGVSVNNDPGKPDIAEGSMIVMDPPVHTAVRKLVNRGFTPRQVRALAPAVQRRVDGLVERLRGLPSGPDGKVRIDYVTEVAAPLPAAVICDLMGIPEADQQRMIDLTNRLLSPTQYGVHASDLAGLIGEIDGYGLDLAKERLAQQREDLTSYLVNGQIADEPLRPDQIGGFFRLLVLAGNETTRTALSHGMLALTEWPEERARWQAALATPAADELAWAAAEEIVRWSSPVMHMKRQVTMDVEVGGVTLHQGDKVVVWYPAINRDDAHIPDPYRFDIERAVNHHGGFGTGGPQFCLGANLARREVAVTLSELLRSFPDIAVDGAVMKVRSNFFHAISELPVSYTPR